MVSILVGLVIVLGAAVGLLFLYISELKRDIKEVISTQHVQDEDILNLMKTHMYSQDILKQHAEILTYLAEQDPLIGKQKVLYPTIVGEA